MAFDQLLSMLSCVPACDWSATLEMKMCLLVAIFLVSQLSVELRFMLRY